MYRQHRNNRISAIMSQPETAFVTTWLTTVADETITLPLVSGYTYDAIVKWGDGSSSNITAYDDADITHIYADTGNHTVKITGTFPAWSFNNTGDRLKIISAHFGTAMDMVYMVKGFYYCSNLTTVTGQIPASVTSLNTSFRDTGLLTFPSDFFRLCINVTDLDSMCRNCKSLNVEVPGLFDTLNKVINFNRIFRYCSAMTGTSGELWLNPSNASNYTLVAPNYDVGLPNGADAFESCFNMIDFATIPTYWK